MTNQTPNGLFVCVSNAGKAVMAQHLMRHIAGDSITALSAGTNANARVNGSLGVCGDAVVSSTAVIFRRPDEAISAISQRVVPMLDLRGKRARL
jgi:protein-tyrosine-phosphatase